MSIVSTSLKGLGVIALVAGGLSLRAYTSADQSPGSAPVAGSASINPAPAQAISPSPDGIALADPHAAAVAEPSAPDAWGGPRTGNEPTLSDRVVNYDIAATLDPVKHIVDGQEKLTWRNRSNREVRAVYLHLYLNGFEGNNSTFFSEKRSKGFGFRSAVNTEDGEWGHIQLNKVEQGGTAVPWLFVHPDGGPDTDHSVVRFDLPTPVPAGGSTTIDINFQDQLPRVVARTGYFGTFHLVGQWFPKIAVLELPGERGAKDVRWNAHEFHLHSEFYADYGNFDVKLTVPKDYTVGATGEEQGEAVVNGDKATHHFVQGDVHDFAWTADNRTAPPLEGTYTGEGSPVVKVKVLYPPEEAASAAPVLKATIDSLKYFSETLGPYPYKTVTAIVPPYNAGEAGGMEYPTFFTAEGYRDIKPDTIDSFFLDFVTIHEFGHGYFYGILGSNEFEEPMLDEGLNDYWDYRMVRERKQSIHMTTPFLKAIGFDPQIQAFEMERITSADNDPKDGTGANSWDRYSSFSYETVYSRTATTMHDLEEQIGKPVLEKAFKEYYKRWEFRHPDIADLQATLAEVSGKPELVAKAFAQQVYSTDKLDDRIEKFTSEEELPQEGTVAQNGKWVELTKEQAEKQQAETREQWKKQNPDAKEGYGPFPYRTTLVMRRSGVAVPENIVVKFADGSKETVLWDDQQRWARYSWVKPVQAVSAEMDPQHQRYLDASMLESSKTINSDASASTRWGAEVGALIESLFSTVETL